jgi:hypothetical protein
MRPITLLEQIATAALALVILSLGWIMLMAAQPTWLRLKSVQMEVLLVLGLLIAALLLVSTVALRQTRR